MRDWLIDARKAKKAKQSAIARAIGVSRTTYWQYERGTKRPTPEHAQQIARILGFKWTRFFEDESNEKAVKSKRSR